MKKLTIPSCGRQKESFQVRHTHQLRLLTAKHLIDHVGLVNDYFSYLKEKLSNSDHTNIIRILMDHEKVDYDAACKITVAKIRQKEQDFIGAGLAVLNDPVLGKNPEVHRWIASLPYVMGGNAAWSQEVRTKEIPSYPP